MLGMAPQDPPPVSTMAYDIMVAADDAIAATQSFTYEARYEGVGSRGARTPLVTGEVVMARRESAGGMSFRIDGAVRSVDQRLEGELIHITLASDGARVVQLHHDEQAVVQTGRRTGDLGSMGALLFDAFTGRRDLASDVGDAEVTAMTDGRAFVGEVLCDVVRMRHPRHGLEYWYVGVEDHLPRRLETHSTRSGQAGARVLCLTNLQVNVELAENAFTLEVPEGYRARRMPPGVGEGGINARRVGNPGGGGGSP